VVAHLYHIAQQKLRYEIVKNRSKNTQKRLYFDLKIANFIQRLGASPQAPISSDNWGFCPKTPGYLNFSKLYSPFEFPAHARLVRTHRKARKNKIDPSKLNDG